MSVPSRGAQLTEYSAMFPYDLCLMLPFYTVHLDHHYRNVCYMHIYQMQLKNHFKVFTLDALISSLHKELLLS